MDDFYEGRAIESNGCIEWTMGLNKYGYGNFRRDGKLYYAHRYFYEKRNGKIPDGLCALHRCDNRKCVNPDHIFLGSRGENCSDMGTKGRASRGINHVHSKITDEIVLKIRSDTRSCKEVSKQYGISTGNVSLIRNRKAWKHVE